MSGDERPPKTGSSLEPIRDFDSKDEDTTAQFWSASRLARADPKLKEAIDRLAAELADVPTPAPPGESLVPQDADGLGGSLARIYAEGRREPVAASDEIPRLPPLSAGREPGENTHPLPDVEDPTVAADDDRDDPRAARPAARRPPEPPAREGEFDEVVGRERTDPGGLLGPVDEFTLSLSDEMVRATRDATEAPRPAPPSPERRPRPIPTPDPLTTGVVRADPLTTGVVASPERSVDEGTAALMLDGLDDLALPAASGRAEPRPGERRPPPPPEESLRLPEVPMPPPDTARAKRMAEPGRPHEPEPPHRLPRDPEGRRDAAPVRDPRPGSRPPPAQRPGRRTPEPPRADLRPPAAAPPPAQPVPSTAAVKRLEQLLTLADEPPEREETISSAMELLSLADAPPEKEETIGADLVRIDAAPLAPLPTFADAPPEKEDTIGGVLEPVEDSVDDLVLPPSVGTQSHPSGRPAAVLESRATRPRATAPPRPEAPPTAPLPPRSSIADESTRPIPVPPQPPPRAPEPPRGPPKPLVSAQLRRETYRPTPVPAPEAPRSPHARRDAPVPGLPPESASGPFSDSLLVWAGTFASLLIGGGIVLLLLILVAYIV